DVIDLRPLLGEAETRTKLTAGDVGDWIWPSDNALSIPLLSKDMQPRGLELPTNRWGARARRDRIEGGTFHFYTDDYRFESLWKNPAPVVNSGCYAVAEPNFSTNDEMPFAVFLWHLYRKRWLSRFWQSHGIEIWADLAVAPRYRQYALLGVPLGWKAYATYSFGSHGIEKVIAEAVLAEEHAGTDEILLWVVCGEESDLEVCRERGWIGTPAHQQAYLRNVGGGKRTSISAGAAISSPNSKTLLDYEEIL
ncbi:DUF4417 domain-containing protein, partial [Methanotrichaceae archaeon M04Ac]